jgi:hypothetical protein
LDYTFHWLELRSVDSTAALSDNSLPRAGDATAASLSDSEQTAVSHTAELSRRDDEASESDKGEALADLWE